MNKQELIKQADYVFQRGNRKLASAYLKDYLTQYPQDEAGWMLMARIAEESGKKLECYERVLSINPNNNEARLWISRIQSTSKTLPKHHPSPRGPWVKNLRWMGIVIMMLLPFLAGSYVFARSNPESAYAKLVIPATATPWQDTQIASKVASQTMAMVSDKYPAQTELVETLIGFAIKNSNLGMEGAPERPGNTITPADSAGLEAKREFQTGLPKAGSLSSMSLTELQLTSWLAMGTKSVPDLPFSDVQVFLRDDKIQLWSMVNFESKSTSALVLLTPSVDENRQPSVQIESIQIGSKMVPEIVTSQVESWFNDMLESKITTDFEGLKIMKISINSGMITISSMR